MASRDKIANKSKSDFHFRVAPAARAKKDGTASVYLRFCINRTTISVNLGFSAPVSKFSNGRFSGYHEAADHNILVGNALARANDIWVECRLKNEQMTRALFLDRYHNSASRDDFYAFCRREIASRIGRYDRQTITKYRSVVKKMQAFSPNLTFADLNYDFVTKFDQYMSRTLGNIESTRAKTHKTVKVFIHEAQKRGIHLSNPYDQFKFKMGRDRMDSLSVADVRRLREIYDNGQLCPRLQNVLQCFLFACFTGLRISDIRSIRKENISADKLTFLPKKNAKNGKTLTVPLNSTSRPLLNDSDPVLPICSAAKMNLYIKEVGKLAGIEKNIHFHLARHTFANLSLELGMPVEILQQVLGHCSIKTTMRYVHLMGIRVVEGMKVWDNFA